MGRPVSFKGSPGEDPLQARTAAQAGGSGSLLRSGRGLRLGLGAVTRTTPGSAKGRGSSQGQRSAPVCSQPVQPVSPATSQKTQDSTGTFFANLFSNFFIFFLVYLTEHSRDARWRQPPFGL